MNIDRVIESYYPDGSLVTADQGRRLGAYLLDTVFVMVTFGIGWFIWFCVVARNGQTPGKQLLGMYIIKADGSRAGGGDTWLREFLFKGIISSVISFFTSGIYFFVAALWCTWDKNAQCLWDKMGSTYVAHSPRGYKPLTAKELRMTGQRLQRHSSYPESQVVQPAVIVPPDPVFAQPGGDQWPAPPWAQAPAQPNDPARAAESAPPVDAPPEPAGETPMSMDATPAGEPSGSPPAPTLAVDAAMAEVEWPDLPALPPNPLIGRNGDDAPHSSAWPEAAQPAAHDLPFEAPERSPFDLAESAGIGAQDSPFDDDSPFDPPPGSATDAALRDLERMRDSGQVSAEEFESRRRDILDRL